jgi:hypothetical protein
MSDTTRTDWRAMEASRDLDRLIAERLGKLGVSVINLTHFSTDLNAAMTLPTTALYFIALHGPVADPDYDNDKQDRKWNAFIEWVWEDAEDEFPTYRGEADTGALAVCRAWLDWRDKQEDR